VEPASISENTGVSLDGVIRHGAIACRACGSRFDEIWGTPFLGWYEAGDVAGLLEIAANARPDNAYPDRATIERLERLLECYHLASDRDAFVKTEEDDFVRAPWFAHRYAEWEQFAAVAEGIPLRGARILDVGAGSGFDCYRLIAAGAVVTALEYNPELARRGRSVVPEARWFGGLAHALPFQSQAFDIVCCNAALHHMQDLEASLEEMLRVLRPGGWLLTTGDPYRALEIGEEHEFDVFDRHPAVLLGVNESIPSFSHFERVLTKHSRALDVKILTANLTPVRPPQDPGPLRLLLRALGKRIGLDRSNGPFRWWRFGRRSHRLEIGNASGSIALRCRVSRAIAVQPRRQGSPVLEAGTYAATLSDYEVAVQTIARHLPGDALDRPFPGTSQTRLELLNGWQKPTGTTQRMAYRRARWFLRRPSDTTLLCFELRNDGAAPATFTVLLNGTPEVAHEVQPAEWQSFSVAVNDVPVGSVLVCELRREGDVDSFDEGLFAVQARRFVGGSLQSNDEGRRTGALV
jgi:SAM-dependent methyltransferase